jgi:hypothetical protein
MDWTKRINNHYQQDLKEEALEIKHIELLMSTKKSHINCQGVEIEEKEEE